MTESEIRIAWINEQRRAIGAAQLATYDYTINDEDVKLFLQAMEFALIFGWYLTQDS